MENNAEIKTSSILQKVLESQRFFLGGIFFIILFFTLYIAREIILPIVVAILLDFLLAPSVKLLKKIYIPPMLGAAVVMFVFLLIIGYGGYFLAKPADEWIKKGPEAINAVDVKLEKINGYFFEPWNSASQVFTKISTLNHPSKVSKQSTTIMESPWSFVGTLFTITGKFFTEVSITVILLYFLLIYDDFFLRKIVSSISDIDKKKEAVIIARQIEDQVWRYLFARTFINIGLAVVVSIILAGFGVPNPVLWGVMVGIFEFIPYIGAFISILIITIVALFTFTSTAYALAVPTTFFIVLFVESNIIAPFVIGRSVTLNPVMVFLSLVFWGWLWGVVGALLSIPIMVTIKIFFENLYQVSFVNELLSE